MFKFLTSKKGAAIEMAISFGLIAFALCTALFTVVLSIGNKDTQTTTIINDSFVVDQIGEYFVRYVGGGTFGEETEEAEGGEAGELPEMAELENGWLQYGHYILRIDVADIADNAKLHTMRLANLGEASKAEPEARLIVTVLENNGETSVVNWSNQSVETVVTRDAAVSNTPGNKNALFSFLTAINKGVKKIKNVVQSLPRGRSRIR